MGADVLHNDQTILFKQEVTQGLDPTPAPATDAIDVSNFRCTPTSDTVSRTPNKPFYVNDEVSYPNKRYDISFDIYLTGSGTPGDAPPFNPIFLACSHAGIQDAGVDWRYNPISGGTTTGTIYYFQGDVLMKVHACRGTISDTAKIGDIRKITVTMVGLYVSPVDQAVAGTPDYSSFRKGITDSEADSVCYVHGVEVDGREMSFTQNNTNEFKESTKTKTIVNTDRKPSGNLKVWLNPLATFDAFALWESEARGEIYWESGTTPGDIVRLTMPQTQIGSPSVDDDEGISSVTFDYIPHPTPTGSDDEYQYIIS